MGKGRDEARGGVGEGTGRDISLVTIHQCLDSAAPKCV